MSTIIRFVPGLLAAGFAFAALQIVKLFDGRSLALELLIFLVIYLVAAVVLDRAMKTYGTRER